MKCLACLVALSISSVAVSRAAIVDFTDVARSYGSNRFLRVDRNPPSASHFGLELRSQTTSQVRLDDVADTATLTGATVTQQLNNHPALGSFMVQTGPPNFPDPTPTFETYTQVFTVNSFAISGDVEFVSSTTAPIVSQGSGRFRFDASVTMSFPDSFTMSGEYKIIGPETMVTTPYSVVYTRSGSQLVTRNVTGSITPGSNYPTTAAVRVNGSIFFNQSHNVAYQPSVATIFDGMVDGINFKAMLTPARMRAFAAAPEPSSASVSLIPLCAAAASLRRQRRR